MSKFNKGKEILSQRPVLVVGSIALIFILVTVGVILLINKANTPGEREQFSLSTSDREKIITNSNDFVNKNGTYGFISDDYSAVYGYLLVPIEDDISPKTYITAESANAKVKDLVTNRVQLVESDYNQSLAVKTSIKSTKIDETFYKNNQQVVVSVDVETKIEGFTPDVDQQTPITAGTKLLKNTYVFNYPIVLTFSNEAGKWLINDVDPGKYDFLAYQGVNFLYEGFLQDTTLDPTSQKLREVV